jgi:hypothetical protein
VLPLCFTLLASEWEVQTDSEEAQEPYAYDWEHDITGKVSPANQQKQTTHTNEIDAQDTHLQAHIPQFQDDKK